MKPPYYYTLTAAITDGGGEFRDMPMFWRTRAAAEIVNRIIRSKSIRAKWDQYITEHPRDYAASFVSRELSRV